MNISTHLAFDAPSMATWLPGISETTFNALDYGVVEMNLVGFVRRYNATEVNYSGLAAGNVVGRHFFRDVAPCCNNRRVAQRYDQSALDETISYVFSLRMKPTPVSLRMIKLAAAPAMFLLVRWA